MTSDLSAKQKLAWLKYQELSQDDLHKVATLGDRLRYLGKLSAEQVNKVDVLYQQYKEQP